MRYRSLSLADRELAEAAPWYELQAAVLGQEFVDEFEAVMSRVMRFPKAYADWPTASPMSFPQVSVCSALLT
jgi:hypothetical protein